MQAGDHRYDSDEICRLYESAWISTAQSASLTLTEHNAACFRNLFYWQAFPMVTRQERINDFDHQGTPPVDQPLQVLCEDHVGTYVVPFLCQWRNGVWQSLATNRRIEAKVVGWRPPRQAQR
jgi:hypothetical protein